MSAASAFPASSPLPPASWFWPAFSRSPARPAAPYASIRWTRCARTSAAAALLDDLRDEIGDLRPGGEDHLVRHLGRNVQHVAGAELRFGAAADRRPAHLARRGRLGVDDRAAVDHRDLPGGDEHHVRLLLVPLGDARSLAVRDHEGPVAVLRDRLARDLLRIQL